MPLGSKYYDSEAQTGGIHVRRVNRRGFCRPRPAAVRATRPASFLVIFHPRQVFTNRGDKAAALVPLVGLRPNAADAAGKHHDIWASWLRGSAEPSRLDLLLAARNRKLLIGCEGHVNKARGGNYGPPPVMCAFNLAVRSRTHNNGYTLTLTRFSCTVIYI